MITWLVSYPRSGNTYLRILLNKVFDIKSFSIHGDHNDIAENSEVSEVVGHVDLGSIDLTNLRDSEQIFYVKSHDLPDNSYFDFKRDRFIYVVRDGREASLSYTHYLNTIAKENVVLSDVILGNVSFGSWGEHVRNWSIFSKSDNFLLLKFEDLMDDVEESLSNISYFISQYDSGTNDALKVPSFTELNTKYPDFFRSGKKSSWQSNYTSNQQQVFEVLFRTELLGMGYEFSSYDPSHLVDYHAALNNQKLSFELMKIKIVGIQQVERLQSYYQELQQHNQSLQQHNQSLQQHNQSLQQHNQSLLLQRDAVLGSIRFKLGSMLLLPIDMLKKLRSHFKRENNG